MSMVAVGPSERGPRDSPPTARDGASACSPARGRSNAWCRPVFSGSRFISSPPRICAAWPATRPFFFDVSRAEFMPTFSGATCGNCWQLDATMTGAQTEFPMVGSVTRPMRIHTAQELAVCGTKAEAAYMAVRVSGMDHEVIAARMPMDAGHLSRMIRGGRPWNDRWQAKFERITGSFALTQWDCKARGAEFYADPVRVELAQLEARRAELLRAAA